MHIGPYTLPSPWILAPMAGVSEKPFRVLARDFGAGAAPTELVSCKGLVYGQARTMSYLDHDARESPFWVQLFGGDEDSMVRGGLRAVELGAKILDINMGCPVRKVTRHGAGSALLCDAPRAAGIVRALARMTGVPITVKIRAGWDADSLTFVDMAKRLEDAGCAALAMHARTRAQGYSGTANWAWIRTLVQATNMPVIGNGDAFDADAARRMLAETGCAAVMVGRGALGDPWIFRRLVNNDAFVPRPAERFRVVRQHLDAHLAFVGDELRAIKRFRQHLMWYARGLKGAVAFRRDIVTIDGLADVLERLEAFFVGAEFDDIDAHAAGRQEFDVGNALG